MPDRWQFNILARILHWTMAAMILTMLFIGVAQVASLADYHLLLSIHRPLGIAVLILVVLRFINRKLSTLPAFPATMSHMEREVAKASEYLMYGLMFVLPLVGWGMLSACALPDCFVRIDLPSLDPSAQFGAVLGAAAGAHGSCFSLLCDVHSRTSGRSCSTRWS